jgi:hypothetical protein
MMAKPIAAFALLVLAVLVCTRPALAQSAEVPRIFIGAGMYWASNDFSDRMSRIDFDDEDPSVFNVEGAIRVARRVSVGAEFFQAKDLTAVMLARSGQTHGEQREHVLLGTARVRLAGTSRVAVDAVGGGGAVFQHHEERVNSCGPTCVLLTRTMTNTAPAFVGGVDLPIRVAPFLAVVPTLRTYFLNRGEHVADGDLNFSWPFQWRSSTRLAAGVSGRVVW